MLGIASLLIDDPPTLEVSDNNLGISGVQRILAVHDFALAMVGSAHLVRLKSYASGQRVDSVLIPWFEN